MLKDLVIDIHKATLVELPKFDLYEVGSDKEVDEVGKSKYC